MIPAAFGPLMVMKTRRNHGRSRTPIFAHPVRARRRYRLLTITRDTDLLGPDRAFTKVATGLTASGFSSYIK
jgi:hypothetical protein